MDNVKASGKMDKENFLPILVSIIVTIITIIVFLIYQSKKTARRGIILTGLCDTGKTLLFAKLVHDKFINTQTSIKENVGDQNINGKVHKVIDIPGHERLRNKFFDQYKPIARGIIYVIDSVTIKKEIRDVAEYLYNILTDSVIQANTPEILILCNKQDLPLAKGSNAVKSILEKELNTLRITKASQLESVDSKSKKNAFLGKDSKEFDFGQLNLNIDFAEVNVTSKYGTKGNIDNLNIWLEKVC